MYVAVTRTKDPLHQPLEVATFSGEAMLPWLQQIEGFEGLLMLSNQEDGTTLVLSFWESRQVAEEHSAARAELRHRVTSTVEVEVEETVGYEVSFAQIESPLFEPQKSSEPDE